MTNPQNILNQFFGFKTFRNGQEDIINSILDSRQVLAILPTGGGKSICYQIPALMSKSFSIVISPLIALMKDQVDSLNKIQKVASFINSSLDYRETENVLSQISSGEIKLLYVSPEKLGTAGFVSRLIDMKPEYLFIDEAHCISEWGHNFRPSYRKISEFIENSSISKIAAFTATATPEVRKDIIQQLRLKNPKVFVKGFERDNLFIHVYNTKTKKEKTVEILKSNDEAAIIYTSTRKTAEEVADYLQSKGVESVYYHAGLTPDLRRLIQDDFLNGRVRCIVSTNAFGMGIDKSDIRTIIHFNMPGTLENYYQEIGRAGRDGKDAHVYLLFDEKDRSIQEYFINTSNPDSSTVRSFYDIICDANKIALGTGANNAIQFTRELEDYCSSKKINAALRESSINILQDSGYITVRSELANRYRCRFLITPNRLKKIIKEFTSGEARDILLIILRNHGSRIFSENVNLNLNEIAQESGTTAKAIIYHLKAFSEAGIIEFNEPSDSKQLVLNTSRISSDNLVINFKRVKSIYENSKQKLDQILKFVFIDDCRFKFLIEYFGEENSSYRCGKCDNCVPDNKIKNDTNSYIEEKIIQTLHESKSPIKQKNIIQILTGNRVNPSFKKFTTYQSCTHFRSDEIIITLQKLSATQLITCYHENYSLSEAGSNSFTDIETAEIPIKNNSDYENDLTIYNALRQIRKDISQKFNQPQSMICPDDVLREIANVKPETTSQLMNIKGVNSKMITKLGNEFINIISSFRKNIEVENKFDQNQITIYKLLQSRYSLEDMCKFTKLPESIVAAQIESIIGMDNLTEVDYLFDKNELLMIRKFYEEGITGLRELREAAGGKISYGKLKIALARFQVS